ncbi:MAG: hypothetical protein ACRDI1_02085 [Actinomycetota bacterium]
MTPAQAAKEWLAAKAILEEHEPRLKAAAEVLKEYFRRTGKFRFRGVLYAVSSYSQFDVKAARSDPDLWSRAKKYLVRRKRETLSRAA